jgi:hypothetical protein
MAPFLTVCDISYDKTARERHSVYVINSIQSYGCRLALLRHLIMLGLFIHRLVRLSGRVPATLILRSKAPNGGSAEVRS